MKTPSSPDTIAARIASVQAQIAAACARCGREPGEVTLVAVSKTRSAEEISAAAQAGLRHFGENRVEEALSKMPAVAESVPAPLAWHMIGHVQGRKARHVLNGFSLLHSLDSLKLATRLSRLLVEHGRTLDVLLEVNVSGEATKAGWNAYNWENSASQRDALWADVAELVVLPGLVVRGLMTMAPLVEDPEKARPVFVRLRELRDALAHDFSDACWSDLSMGMTDDFPVAIEEGATIVRIGRAIFGSRTT